MIKECKVTCEVDMSDKKDKDHRLKVKPYRATLQAKIDDGELELASPLSSQREACKAMGASSAYLQSKPHEAFRMLQKEGTVTVEDLLHHLELLETTGISDIEDLWEHRQLSSGTRGNSKPGRTRDFFLTPSVDQVALETRASSLATRSIKTDSKRAALELSIKCMDLTTLEGADTREKVSSLCRKAIRPDATNSSIPSVAAVCVYPEMVEHAAEFVAGTSVKVASVAGAFPSGLSNLNVRLSDIADAVSRGADEIDIVLNRSAFLTGKYVQAADEISAAKEACGEAHLKVILETGEIGGYDQIRRASELAMHAGADFIKTSTGKISKASTLPVVLCMAEAIRDHADRTGQIVGLKAAGGIRTAKQAWHYLVVIGETLGQEWLTPDMFRIGASSLLNDVLQQLGKIETGRYFGPNYVTVD